MEDIVLNQVNTLKSYSDFIISINVDHVEELVDPIKFNNKPCLNDVFLNKILNGLDRIEFDQSVEIQVVLAKMSSFSMADLDQLFTNALSHQLMVKKSEIRNKMNVIMFSILSGCTLLTLLFLLESILDKTIVNLILIEIVKIGSWMLFWTGLHTRVYDFKRIKQQKINIQRLNEDLTIKVNKGW